MTQLPLIGIFSGDPTFEVGQIAHGRKDRLPADPAGNFDTVAGRIDIRIGGLHVLVDRNPAEFAGFQPGSDGEAAVGADADGHDRQFAVNHRVIGKFDPGEFAVLAEEFLDALGW